MKIRTKQEMYDLYHKGYFGVKLKTWPSVLAYLADDFPGLVALRYKQPNMPFCAYYLTRETIEAKVEEFVKNGADRALLHVSELANDSRILMQGEYSETSGTPYLFYTFDKHPMRIALKNSSFSESNPAKVRLLLKMFMAEDSYEEFLELADQYCQHGNVIEFSVYSELASSNTRNVLVWEVRHY